MPRQDPWTTLEGVLTAMKSPAVACEVRPADRGPAAGLPHWTVRPYLRAREIRLAWSERLLAGDGPSCGGLWHLDTELNRLRLTRAVAEGQRLFGTTSHWLEERDA